MNGKGDIPRPVNGDKYRENYDAIFRKPEWPDIIGVGSCLLADSKNPVFDGPRPRMKEFMKHLNSERRRMKDDPGIATVPRLEHIRSLIARVKYKDWNIKSDFMGNVFYIQPQLSSCDSNGNRWTGRKWYVSNFATEAEIVNTIFKSILTAEEHETREEFLFDGAAIYGPHLSLETMVANANATEHRQD